MTTQQLLAQDPIWLSIVKVVVLFVFGVVMTLFMIWLERRVVARMQHRPGPNRVGPAGLLQSLADGLKLAFKEDIRPVLADKWVFFIAPVISTIPAFLAFSVIPFGPEVSMFGHRTAVQLTDMPVSLLVVLACSSLGVYGIVLAGWSSGSPYPLLGSLRSAAQVISYEIAMGLSIVGVILSAHSLSTGDIVAAQAHEVVLGIHLNSYWLVLFPSFVIYLISMVGETNRAPFDLPEAESELVGGFHTEYSSLKFALFFLAEYVNMVVVSCLATTMFLGGWVFPFVGLDSPLNQGWLPIIWFLIKTFIFLFVFIWLRGTLPRTRYDQFMRLGWKVLVPANLVWILIVATMQALRNDNVPTKDWLIAGGVVIIVLVVIAFLVPEKQVKDPDQVPVTGGGYPVPPLNLKVPKPPQRRRPATGVSSRRRPAAVVAGSAGDTASSTTSTSEEATDGNS